ncbi:hypothetical protein M1295_02375 [Patescibacteria group bacterium]|nr:hypothetical protein [Patescibacteria group bacterium]
MRKFFSWEINWRRILSIVLASAVILILGFLVWYFVLYLSLIKRIENNQKTTNELQQLNELGGPPISSSTNQ